jgi:hypothetical protein
MVYAWGCVQRPQVTFGHGIVREREYQVRFTVRFWARVVGDTVVDLYPLPDRLPQCHFVHHKYHMTWPGMEPGPPPFLPRLLEIAPRAVRQRLWFSSTELQRTLGKMFRSGWTRHIQEHGFHRRGPLGLHPTDIFLWGHLKEYVYANPPRTIEDLVAKFQAAVTTVDANVLKACSKECRAAHCHLPWNGRRPLRIPIITTNQAPMFWSDGFHHFSVTCMFNTERHRSYVVLFFYFFKWNHTMEVFFANFVSPYLCTYCNGFCQRVARQQLCKHGPTRNNKWGYVFYVVRADQQWNNWVMQPASRQRLGKHISAYRTVLWKRWRQQQ